MAIEFIEEKEIYDYYPVRLTYIPYTKTYSSFQCCRHQNIILMELESVSLVMQMKQKMPLLICQ